MMAALTLAVYGSLVGLTLWVSWRNEVIQAVGWALAFSWIASIAAHYYLPVSDQPQAYSVCETAVLSMAFFSHVLGAGRAMVALVAVSMISIGANFYVSTFETLTRTQINTWELATNACFVLENLLVIVPMVYDRACHRIFGRGSGAILHGSQASAD